MAERLLLLSALLFAFYFGGAYSFRVRRQVSAEDSGRPEKCQDLEHVHERIRDCFQTCKSCQQMYGFLNYDYETCATACSISCGLRTENLSLIHI